MKTITQRTHKRRRGQSTVEFALMMPILMTFFFWIFEANIYFVASTQAAYSAYASARSVVTMHGRTNMPQNDVPQAILTGRIWQQVPPQTRVHQLTTGGLWGQPDGVTVRFGAIGSLPYARGLLRPTTTLPTHLGPDEWNRQLWPDPKEQDTGNFRDVTDNNLPVQ